MSHTFVPQDLPAGHSAALTVPYLCERLGLALSLVDDRGWHAIYALENVVSPEAEHGREVDRWKYNDRSMSAAARARAPVVTEHAGCSDVFAPVVAGGDARQMLIAGPFLRRRPTSGDLVERWQALSGGYPDTSDPEFVRYAGLLLGTAVYDDECLALLVRMMATIAELLAATGDARAHSERIAEMADALGRVTRVPRMWDDVRDMTHPSGVRAWTSPVRSRQLADLGMPSAPVHALSALITSADPAPDPVGDLVARDALLRASADLAYERGGAACGRVGDHALTFVAPGRPSSARARLEDLLARASRIARSFRLRLHAGMSLGERPEALPTRVESALSAAEMALSRGETIVVAGHDAWAASDPIAELRRDLARLDARPPFVSRERFERYLSVVAVHTGHRAGAARLEVEAGFARLVDALEAGGLLEPAERDRMVIDAERAARAARGMRDLFSVYRAACAEVERAVTRPAEARTARNLRAAVLYMRAHLHEPLRLADVARAGRFTSHYFSRLFRQREQITFESYLQRLRVERAQSLLLRTELDLASIARLSGFAHTSYFHRVFRKVTGDTPRAYRVRAAENVATERKRAQRG